MKQTHTMKGGTKICCANGKTGGKVISMFKNFDYNVKAYSADDYDGWIIEIVRFKGIIEVWLSHMDYGTKSLLFGIDHKDQTDDEILTMVNIGYEIFVHEKEIMGRG